MNPNGRNAMRKPHLSLLLAGVVSAGCATGGGAAALRQADAKLPQSAEVSDQAERKSFDEANWYITMADIAWKNGNADEASTKWRAAGKLLSEAAQKFPTSEYRLVYRAQASRLLLQGGEPGTAVTLAEQLAAEPTASAATRALAAQLRATALQAQAFADAKAGKLEVVRIVTADRRKGADAAPRPIPEAWRRVVAANDDYLGQRAADPSPNSAQVAASLSFVSAEIAFSYDQIDDANRRLTALLRDFPTSTRFDDAALLLLQTYLVKKDDAGYAAALDRLLASVAQESAKAAAKPGDADAKAQVEMFGKLTGDLARLKVGLGFKAASQLLAEVQKLEGEPARLKALEAAAAYDKFASENPDHPDAPNAIYNAAIAWSRGREPKKALADRELVATKYPESKIAPKALAAAASDLSAAGDHAGSAQRYVAYLEKYPTGEDRCLALYNVGVELDYAKQGAEAAKRYVAFAADAQCSKEKPGEAVKVLNQAAVLYTKAGKKAEAADAQRAAEEAKARLK